MPGADEVEIATLDSTGNSGVTRAAKKPALREYQKAATISRANRISPAKVSGERWLRARRRMGLGLAALVVMDRQAVGRMC
ncbi:MAG: hypothetical protein DWI57_13420 [Chloroflexi bacterium]|nr:MAG: hypothetical protein DWI57_13420 [Chloroflexota bacterium]